jgi:hypothetical protein
VPGLPVERLEVLILASQAAARNPAIVSLWHTVRQEMLEIVQNQLFPPLKGLSIEICWLKVVSSDRSLFKGNAPRFLADFVHPLSSERPFKFPHHLVWALEIN